jgi:dienelactone hydrolase
MSRFALAGLALVLACKDKPAPSTGSGSGSGSGSVGSSGSGSGSGSSAPAPTDPQDVIHAFFDQLAKHDIPAAIALVDPRIASKVTPEFLTKTWSESGRDSGALTAQAAFPDPIDPRVFYITMTFEHRVVRGLVKISNGKVAGFHLDGYEPPSYVNRTAFTEVPFAVGSGKLALPGVLSLPKGVDKPPVVILIQGSGQHDLDSGMGPALPFRDLAWGLASKGVAVARYDKRTSLGHFAALGIDPKTATIQNEYTDDFAAAVKSLAARTDIDASHIYVLGHSQGGWLVPWLMRDHPELAGAIIASGNARHFADILPEQYRYLYNLMPGASKAQLDEVVKQATEAAKLTHDPKLPDDTDPNRLPLKIAAPYWKSLVAYDASKVAAAIAKPILLLQGGRDYNVTMMDHAMWKKALVKATVTAHDYPKLNHIYVIGEQPATPNDYTTAGGHVAQTVIDDIATWVKAQK